MWIFERLTRRQPPRHVVLYGKPGCHLCDDARVMLLDLGRRFPIDLEEIDIRGDPALFRQYDVRIPVLVIDGRTELEAPITRKELQRALRTRQLHP